MQEPSSPMSTILHDRPEEIADLLGYQPYADTLANLIADPNTQSPLTIGIFGSWGSGKTSLMKMIKSRLDANSRELLRRLRESPASADRQMTHSIWFNAWLYSKEETLWRALIAQVIAGIRDMPLPPGYNDPYEQQEKQNRLDAMSVQLYRVVTEAELGSFSISGGNLVQDEGAQAAQLTLTLQQGLDLLENIAPAGEGGELEVAQRLQAQVREATVELEQARVESLVRFQEQFQDLVSEYVLPYGYLIVFVDDLDRCLPDKAVEVLEAMKLFMDVPGCIFVLGIDKDVIERGIRLRYRELGRTGFRELAPLLMRAGDQVDKASEFNQLIQKLAGPGEHIIDGDRYLEKIIQIPFVLPPISQRAMAEFIVGSVPNLPHPQCARVFAEHLERNPRQVKRAINIFTLLWRLSQSGSNVDLKRLIRPVRLAKVVVLQQRHEEIYESLREDPSRLITWERQLRNEGQEKLQKGPKKLEGQANRPQSGIEPKKARDEGQQEGDEEVEKVVLADELVGYDDLAALRSLLLMDHPQTGPEATPYVSFYDMTPTEARAFIFLASTVEDTGRTTEEEVERIPKQEPPDEAIDEEVEEMVGVEDEAAFIEVGADLSESAIGSYEQRAYSLMESYSTLSTRMDEFPADARGQFVYNAAEIGNALLHEVPGLSSQSEALKSKLADESSVTINISRAALQLPWEIVADSQGAIDDKDPERPENLFWGFQHAIQRMELGSSKVKSATTSIRSETSPPEILLVVDEKSRQYREVMEMSERWSRDGRARIQMANDLEKFLFVVKEGIGDIIYIHGRGSQFRKELWVELGGERLSYGRLDNWYQSVVRPVKGAGLKTGKQPPTGVKRKPGTALYVFDANASMGRRNEWLSWLEVLYEIGAGAVLAPMAAPNLTWSGLFLEKFIDAVLRGEEIGRALLGARNEFLHDTGNPLSLYFALFGDVRQRLRPMSERDDPNADQSAI